MNGAVSPQSRLGNAMSDASNIKAIYVACLLAWTLDAMDFQLLFLALPDLIKSLQLSPGEAAIVPTVTLVSTAIGGWLGGAAADRFGRVRTLSATVLCFSLGAALSAFVVDFYSLLGARIVAGLGFGAEWSAGAILLSEWTKPGLRGRLVGSMLAGWGVGWAAAILVYWLAYRVGIIDEGWRLAFAAGVLPALLVLYIRRAVKESPIYQEARARSTGKLSFLAAQRQMVLSRWSLIAIAMASCAQGAYYALYVWLPSYYRTVLEVPIGRATQFLLVAAAGSMFGSIGGAFLSDYAGRRRTLWILATALIICIFTLTNVEGGEYSFYLVNFLAGFLPAAIYATLTPLLAELFPTSIRANAAGFCFNSGRAIGAVFPSLVGTWQASLGLGLSIAVFVTTGMALLILLVALLPETTRVRLDQVSGSP
jgi:MFS family permease